MILETWLPVVGWENFYEISSYGNVRSIGRKNHRNARYFSGKDVKKLVSSVGYYVVNLTGNGSRKQVFIHKMVLEAFVGPRPYKHDACHNDGNKLNCNLSNLRWDTRKSNHQDKKKHGTYQEGPRANNIKLTEQQVIELFLTKKTYSELAKQFCISKSTVQKIKRRQTWSCVTNELNKNGVEIPEA